MLRRSPTDPESSACAHGFGAGCPMCEAETVRQVASRPRPVAHDGFLGCGPRQPSPCGAVLGPYLPAEKLRNGTVVGHICGTAWRPGDPITCEGPR